ncbi:MAG TPA: hypothetical protein VFT84_07815, partial [Gemmatimonadales bacterium]|nr:hypothetical protein [Gemmatimonadales bacterium]
MGYRGGVFVLMGLSGAAMACDSYNSAGPGGDLGIEPISVVAATGDLTARLTEFRATVGDPVNGGGAGPQPGGRREIKWDGVPGEQVNTNTFPEEFFLNAGLISTTDGTGLRVSDNDFRDVNPSYEAEFEAFSPTKTFMATGSARMTLELRVPGSQQTGLVNGIGIVFSDVDHDGTTYIEPFTADGASLGRYVAPPRTDAAGHSFIGVVYDRPLVARVEVFSGEAALAAGRNDVSNGGEDDLVVTDDFIY